MDAGSIAAWASFVSAIIIALTAVVALRQLRHYRNANDIVVYLRLIDQLDSPAMLEARKMLVVAAEKIASDPEYRERLKDPKFMPEEFLTVGPLLRFLEHISVLVTRGRIAEHLILAEYADNFVSMWEIGRPAIVQRRVAFGKHTARAFEHLAMRAKRYIDSGQMAREYDTLERDTRDLPMI